MIAVPSTCATVIFVPSDFPLRHIDVHVRRACDIPFRTRITKRLLSPSGDVDILRKLQVNLRCALRPHGHTSWVALLDTMPTADNSQRALQSSWPGGRLHNLQYSLRFCSSMSDLSARKHEVRVRQMTGLDVGVRTIALCRHHPANLLHRSSVTCSYSLYTQCSTPPRAVDDARVFIGN